MHYFLFIVFIFLSIKNIQSQVNFASPCSIEAGVSGLSSIDGNDEFEIDLYEAKYLPDDVVLCKKIKILRNYLKIHFIPSGNQTKTTKLWY